MPVPLLRQEGAADSDLYRPESRFPLEPDTAVAVPDLNSPGGPAPFAFRFLTPVTSTGGVLPADIRYDEATQTGTYDDLPPGVFMTKNPPMTYFTTEATDTTPEQTDARDDPGPSDD
ncbi:putative ATP-grasp-modified RiPP [Streptomyces millisiae]|uniref:ATP-grasp-modified RiPP n=1 Tax=Streptomyces millisiae TaxID=3075542 RepID=A0ABU2LZP5_9ACTN|nr:putative ATP-grasp-modified RiPP [Streptomyces sp. DSM 44918]MDT0323041.1 putative ATP-grasp-modified RiPP [Streptomyces sp. DSM 44918]